MATVIVPLFPGPVSMPGANAPQMKYPAGTNFTRDVMAFDPTTVETVYFRFRAARYASGNLTVRINWSAPSGITSGDVVFGAALAAITPDTDTTDIETKAFATATTVTDSHLGTTARREMTTTITVSNLDSLAADDDCFLKFYRDATNVADTMNSADAIVETVFVEYSDT